MKKTNLLQTAVIYFLLFIGSIQIIGIVFGILIKPLLPYLFGLVSSPNYIVAPATIGAVVLNFLTLILAILFSARIVSKLLPASDTKKSCWDIDALLYTLPIYSNRLFYVCKPVRTRGYFQWHTHKCLHNVTNP